MSGFDNPYGSSLGGQMTGAAQFGNDDPIDSKLDIIKDTTTAKFAIDVIEASKSHVVLVDFWAPWCGPCKQLAPVIEKVVAEASGRVKLVKLDIDKHPAIPGQLGIQSIPAVVAFKDGRPVDGFMGAVPESQIREFIEKVAGSADADEKAEIEAALKEAEQFLEAGDYQTAGQIYGTVMQAQPDNATAIAGIADCMIAANQHDRALELLTSIPDELGADARVQLVRKKLEQFEEARKLGDPTALLQALSLNEDDHASRINLAKILNAQGDRNGAAEQLLTVMKKDRGYDDDGARKLLLEFFEAWGFKDPASVAGRRKLSAVLFS